MIVREGGKVVHTNAPYPPHWFFGSDRLIFLDREGVVSCLRLPSLLLEWQRDSGAHAVDADAASGLVPYISGIVPTTRGVVLWVDEVARCK